MYESSDYEIHATVYEDGDVYTEVYNKKYGIKQFLELAKVGYKNISKEDPRRAFFIVDKVTNKRHPMMILNFN